MQTGKELANERVDGDGKDQPPGVINRTAIRVMLQFQAASDYLSLHL